MMLLVGIGCTGCSAVAVHARSTTASSALEGGHRPCTRSYVAPIVDTGLAVSNLAGMASFSLVNAGPKSDAQKTVAEAYLATSGVLAAVYAISAIYGYSTVSTCKRYGDAFPGMSAGEIAANAPAAFETAGFHLGNSAVEAREDCASSGRVWVAIDGGQACKGPAHPPLGERTTRLYFQATRLSIIEADVRPPGEDVESWSAAYRELQRTLKQRYGAPAEKSLELPDECKPEAAFMQCLTDGKIRGTTRWSLQNGTTVVLSVAPENGSGIIRVRFTAKDAAAAGTQAKNASP
jgi:hypothetical protein